MAVFFVGVGSLSQLSTDLLLKMGFDRTFGRSKIELLIFSK